MSRITVIAIFATSLICAAVWQVGVVGCPPEEDACASAVALAVWIATIGLVLGAAVTAVAAAVLWLTRLAHSRRREGLE